MTPRDLEDAFVRALQAVACPGCRIDYTAAAGEWCLAWSEGRHDLLVEMGTTERDGRVKVKCEFCGGKAWYDCFAGTATPVEGGARSRSGGA